MLVRSKEFQLYLGLRFIVRIKWDNISRKFKCTVKCVARELYISTLNISSLNDTCSLGKEPKKVSFFFTKRNIYSISPDKLEINR